MKVAIVFEDREYDGEVVATVAENMDIAKAWLEETKTKQRKQHKSVLRYSIEEYEVIGSPD